MVKRLLLTLLFVGIVSLLVGGLALVWGYNYVTRDLPNFDTVDDYHPPAVSQVFSHDGILLGEFYRERRYPVKLDEIPVIVRNAFLAAEDASFYAHPGIDPLSILRAVIKNFQSGTSKQGASTITQQVVKNILLTPERKLIRKIKEAILSYRLERRLSKDEILEIYLNQIFFGNTAYGIKAAAKLYFHKELKELNLAEASLLAGLPKAPSKYSPLVNLPRAKRRQRYVLGQMVKAQFTTQEEADNAYKERINLYEANSQNIFHAPYYLTELRLFLKEHWPSIDIDADGLTIQTPVNLIAEQLAERSLKRGIRQVDKRQGWRGPLAFYKEKWREQYENIFAKKIPLTLDVGTVYPALVVGIDKNKTIATILLGNREGELSLKDSSWARKVIDKTGKPSPQTFDQLIKVGSVVEVSLAPFPELRTSSVLKVQLDQTPLLEGALVLLEPSTGRVITTIGGYDFKRSQFNRVTQSFRQPGSSFKPIVYLAAVDGHGYTPSTIVSDSPRTFRWGDEFWSPHNFDGKFLGSITLQKALEQSRNLVSADIVSKIGVSPIIQYARKLGITSPIGKNLSISLGSSEVTLLELARAYGVFSARGILFPSTFVDKIISRKGELLYDSSRAQLTSGTQAISEESAFIMAHMMKGTIERGTATSIRSLGRVVSGKTGTTNDHMDAWFLGYTPQWVCGVWIGFDVKREIGAKETGGRVAAPIWLHFMQDFLAYDEARKLSQFVQNQEQYNEEAGLASPSLLTFPQPDFLIPNGVDAYWVNPQSGSIVPTGTPGALLEYFKKGNKPRKQTAPASESDGYLLSPDL